MFLFSCSDFTPINILIRIMTSLILGCLIGLDRGTKRRGAGAKTSFIICISSTLVMLTSQYMDITFPGQTDLSRMAAQVISGVGFLGVGTIIVSRYQVKGLSTAASLWSCACIGIATGIGFIDISIFVTLLMIVVLHIIPIIERRVYKLSKYLSIYIDIESNESIPEILDLCKKESIEIENFDIIRSKSKKQPTSVIATIRVPDLKKVTYYFDALEAIEGVISVENL